MCFNVSALWGKHHRMNTVLLHSPRDVRHGGSEDQKGCKCPQHSNHEKSATLVLGTLLGNLTVGGGVLFAVNPFCNLDWLIVVLQSHSRVHSKLVVQHFTVRELLDQVLIHALSSNNSVCCVHCDVWKRAF